MSIPDDYIGEPGYPAPWTTSTPREGLRDTDQALIISLAPDVCRSPGTPVPYPVVDFCGHDENYTPSVRFTGQKAMVMRSNTRHVHGDEPGIGKGVVSNTVGGISEPIEHASQVRAEGRHVIRHLDRFHMNNRNTVGEAIFVRDTASYPAPKDDDPLPGSIQLADASPNWAQYAQAAPTQTGSVARQTPAPRPGSAPAPAPRPTPARPGGTVIKPDFPQWRRPPPTSPTAGYSYLQRLGRFGRKGAIFSVLTMDMRSTPTIPFPRRGADAFERKLFDTANDLLDPWDAEHNNRVRDWYNSELEAHRSTPLPQEAPISPSNRAEPAARPENVRVDRQACYPLTLHFSTPANGTRAEMLRQLRLQQTVLNSKNPCVAAQDMNNYPINKPIGERARTRERLRIITQNAKTIKGMVPGMTDAQALAAANKAAAGKDAIHTLDMIAGGQPTVFSGLGGRSENRSIGAQWGPGGKATTLKAYAISQCQNRCPMMQTTLLVI